MDWNFVTEIATIFTAFATFLQVFVTYLVARRLRQLSSKSEKASTIRSINEQWQELLMLGLKNEETLRILGDIRYESHNEEVIKRRHVLYYIFNILETIFHAEKSGQIDKKYAETVIREQIKILSKSGKEFSYIMSEPRGYDHEFISYIKSLLNE